MTAATGDLAGVVDMPWLPWLQCCSALHTMQGCVCGVGCVGMYGYVCGGYGWGLGACAWGCVN